MKRLEWELAGLEGVKLFVREWKPEKEQPPAERGVVCLLHGMGEHGDRYAHVAARLTAEGFAVLAMDQQGHGRTAGSRGYMPSIETTVSYVGKLLDAASERYPGLPRYLYGHSMGGNVILNAALRLKPDIQGVIATSPWLRLAFSPPAVQLWAGRIIARVAPGLPQSTGLKPEQLYRPGYPHVSPIEGDPLNHTRITVKTFLEIQAAGEWALAHIQELNIPLLLLHGSADQVTSYAASAAAAEKLGDRCRFISWDGGFHELHNDIDAELVIDSIIEWLKR
ncbi:alpha/beta hydrolase [Paenibacillus sp. NPDC058174]|uniref:alpha/beta hydrolase n=1 Tax=Paenibacillus sp. NPDC058174 TaxID=3346366 RepID=UPI0036DE773F